MHNTSKSVDNRVKNNVLRWILISSGWIAIVIGVIGIFLPLLPTVPFLLLAAACFARSSEHFHTWLVEHNHLGPLIRDYLNGRGIPLRVKRIAIGMVWLSFLSSIFLLAPGIWVKIILVAIAMSITLYLLALPTFHPKKKEA